MAKNLFLLDLVRKHEKTIFQIVLIIVGIVFLVPFGVSFVFEDRGETANQGKTVGTLKGRGGRQVTKVTFGEMRDMALRWGPVFLSQIKDGDRLAQEVQRQLALLHEARRAGIQVSDEELWRAIRRYLPRGVAIEYVIAEPDKLADKIEIGEDELRAYYEAHKADFERSGKEFDEVKDQVQQRVEEDEDLEEKIKQYAAEQKAEELLKELHANCVDKAEGFDLEAEAKAAGLTYRKPTKRSRGGGQPELRSFSYEEAKTAVRDLADVAGFPDFLFEDREGTPSPILDVPEKGRFFFRQLGFIPGFGQDKRFHYQDKPHEEAYAAFLQRYLKLDSKAFAKTMREKLTITKLQSFVGEGLGFVPADLVREQYIRENEKRDVKYIEFRADQFRDQAEVDEKELKEFYNRYKDKKPDAAAKTPGYLEPEQIKIEYVMAKPSAIEIGEIPDGDIKRYYEKHKDAEFVAEEEKKEEEEAEGDEEEKEADEDKADAAEAEDEKAEPAKEEEAKDEAADAAADPDEKAEPAKEEEAKDEAADAAADPDEKAAEEPKVKYKPLADVRNEIIKKLKEQRQAAEAEKRLREAGEAAAQAAKKTSLELKSIAKRMKLEHAQTKLFTKDQIPRTDVVKELAKAKDFDTTVFELKTGEISRDFELDDGSRFFCRVLEREEAHALEFEELKDDKRKQVEKDLRGDKGFELALKEMEEYRGRIFEAAFDRFAKLCALTPLALTEVKDFHTSQLVPNVPALKRALGELGEGELSPIVEDGGKCHLALLCDRTEEKGADVKILSFEPEKLAALDAELADPEVEAYFDRHQKDYEVKEGAKVEFLQAHYAAMKDDVEVTEDEVKAFYEENREAYVIEEAEEKEGDEGDKEEDKGGDEKEEEAYQPFEKVKEEIEKTLVARRARALARELLAKAAKDVAEAEDKPDLAKIAEDSEEKLIHGQPEAFSVEATEKVADIGRAGGFKSFVASGKAGDVSEILRSAEAAFLCRLVEKEEEGIPELEAIKERVRKDLGELWTPKKATERARWLLDDVILDTFVGMPEEHKLAVARRQNPFIVRTTPALTEGQVSGTWADKKAFLEAVFGLKKDKVSNVIVEETACYLARVKETESGNELTAKYVAFYVSDFKDWKAPVPEAEAREFHRDQPDRFRRPLEVRGEYIVAKVEVRRREIAKTLKDDVLLKYYDEHKDEKYKDGSAPGKYRPFVRVRGMIESELSKGKAEAEMTKSIEAAAAKLEGLGLERAPEPEPGDDEKPQEDKTLDPVEPLPKMQEIAKEVGLEYGTADYFSRDARSVPGIGYHRDLARAAFAAKPGQVTGILSSGSAKCIFRVLERRASHVPKFEDVREQAEMEVRRAKALEAAKAKAEEFRAKLDGRSFDETFKGAYYRPLPVKKPIEVRMTQSFVGPDGAVKDLGARRDVHKALAALEKGALSDVIQSQDDSIIAQIVDKDDKGQLKYKFVILRYKDFWHTRIEVTDEEMRTYLEDEKNRLRFRGPATVRAEYLFIPRSRLEGDVAVAPEEVRAEYEKLKGTRYRRTDKDGKTAYLPFSLVEKALTNEVRARRLDEYAAKLAKALLEEIRGLEAKKKGSANFQELAKKYEKYGYEHGTPPPFKTSESPKNWGLAGRIPELARVARESEVGDVPDALVCPGGRIICRFLEKQEAPAPDLEKLRPRLRQEIRKGKAPLLCFERAQALRKKMERMSMEEAVEGEFLEMATERSLEPQEVKRVRKGPSVPRLGRVPELNKALFALKKAGDVTPVVCETNACYIAEVTEFAPSVKAEYAMFYHHTFEPRDYEPTEDELKKQYEENKDKYKRADSYKVEYLIAENWSMRDRVPEPSPEELTEYYEKHKTAKYKNWGPAAKDKPYKPFEEVERRVKGQLLTEKAQTLADEAMQELGKALESKKSDEAKIGLEELAKSYGLTYDTTDFFSEDTPPHKIGRIGNGSDIAKAAAKAEAGVISPVLSSSQGPFVYRFLEKKDAYLPERAEVEEEVKKDVRSALAREKAKVRASEVRDKILASDNPDDFERIIRQEELVTTRLEAPRVGSVEGVTRPQQYAGIEYAYINALGRGNKSRFANAVFELRPGVISPPIHEEKEKDKCYLVALEKDQGADLEEFEKSGRRRMESTLGRRLSSDLLGRWQRSLTSKERADFSPR